MCRLANLYDLIVFGFVFVDLKKSLSQIPLTNFERPVFIKGKSGLNDPKKTDAVQEDDEEEEEVEEIEREEEVLHSI